MRSSFEKLAAACVLALAIGVALPAAAATPAVITEFSVSFSPVSPSGITAGPDGNLWFADINGAIDRITTAGVITEFSSTIGPQGITAGPDGNLWFTDQNNTVGRITTAGVITEFSAPAVSAGITTGPDGNLWFTNIDAGVGRITTVGVVTEFPTGLNPSEPLGITSGPDGNLWFTDFGVPAIGRITTAGVITEFTSGLSSSAIPVGITAGPDGNLWFVNANSSTPAIGRITPAGVITEFSAGLNAGGVPFGITVGRDGNLWFADQQGAIGRITTAGVITEFSQGINSGADPLGITAGPDGNIWFTDNASGSAIGRLVPPTDLLSVSLSGAGAGQVTSMVGTGVTNAGGAITCVSGSSNACSVSFADATTVTLTATAAQGSHFIGWSGAGATAGGCTTTAPCAVPLTGNLDSAVTASFSPNPTENLAVITTGSGGVVSLPSGINCGSGAGVCMASYALGTTVTLNATPAQGFVFSGWSGGGCGGVETCTVTFNELAAPPPNTGSSPPPATVVNATFFARSMSNVTLVSSLLPTSRSVQVGATATSFATIINTSPDTAGFLCQLQPATSIPAAFSFQTTDPATNGLTGTVNTTVTVAPGAAQSFVIGFTPTATFAPTEVAFTFTCANSPAADTITGVNTLLLSASATPTPDLVAISETATDDGILDLPGPTGIGAFALAADNVGATDTITVTANTGGANLPVTIGVCQTVAATGACMAPPSANVTTMVATNATPTFSVFVQGHASVPFQPAANRVFVQFKGSDGTVRGATSVAVRTQAAAG